MTAASALRLILGLGVLNLVLATIALGIGGRNSSSGRRSVRRAHRRRPPGGPAASPEPRRHPRRRVRPRIAGRDPVSATTQHRSDRRESVAVDRGQPRPSRRDPGRRRRSCPRRRRPAARRHARADGRAEHRPDPGARSAVHAGPDGSHARPDATGHTRADAPRHAAPTPKPVATPRPAKPSPTTRTRPPSRSPSRPRRPKVKAPSPSVGAPPPQEQGTGSRDRPCTGGKGKATAADLRPAVAGRYRLVGDPPSSGCVDEVAALGSRPGPSRRSQRRLPMAPSDPRQTKFVLDESRIPRAWYNIAADLPVPRRRHSIRAPGSRSDRTTWPAVPDGADRPGGLGRARDRDPRAGPGRLSPLPAEPALPGPPLERALDTPAHIYYKYEGVSPAGSHKPNTAIPQAFFNQQEGVKRLATETGAGQWGAPCVRGCAVRPRGQGLHGPRELRPEAVPADPHGDVRRRGRRQPVARPRTTGARSSARRPTARARSGSPSAKPSRTPPPVTTPSTRWARCSITCSCTRRSSARRPSSRWVWPASRRTSSSAARAADRTSPG